MLDPSMLSTSQKPLNRSSSDDSRETDKIPIAVPDLSASSGSWQKSKPSLSEAIQGAMKIASSIELSAISSSRYVRQEKEAISFFQFRSQFGILVQKYALRNWDETVRVLEKNPSLILFLVEIHKQILPYFPTARFFLKADVDPEADDINEGFVVSIVTSLRPREALDRLEKFYENWWLTLTANARGREKISFNLESI